MKKRLNSRRRHRTAVEIQQQQRVDMLNQKIKKV